MTKLGARTKPYKPSLEPKKDKKLHQPKMPPYDTGAIDGKALHTHNRDKLPKGSKRPPVKYKEG